MAKDMEDANKPKIGLIIYYLVFLLAWSDNFFLAFLLSFLSLVLAIISSSPALKSLVLIMFKAW